MWTVGFLLLLQLGGCSSKSAITNERVMDLSTISPRYDFVDHIDEEGLGDILFLLAFSGGGTRAAALSYGVMEELNNTYFLSSGGQLRLLDEVDRINSVSGGSFTAAYYGLFGDELFSRYKQDFLYKDIEESISNKVFNVFNMIGRVFTETSRTEEAINIYDEEIFRGKTFGDFKQPGRPYILINSTDLNSRDQFVFSQQYFDLICSDLSSFKVSRAVAASSAVPVLFDPILMERYQNCSYEKPSWLIDAEKRAGTGEDLRLAEVVDSLNFYLDPGNPPYLTLVDGGVTDNLGLRSLLNTMMLYEEAEELDEMLESSPQLKHVIVLVVNASTVAETEIGKTEYAPSVGDVLTAVTDIQLHRYNLESNSLIKEELRNWAHNASQRTRPLESYFIELSVDDVEDTETYNFMNTIPTSLSLERDQVDTVITTAKKLLRKNPEYLRLLQNIGAVRTITPQK